MALDPLLYASTHRAAYDLEYLFYVLLFVCTHFDGPDKRICTKGVYDKETTLPMAKCFSKEGSFHQLLGHVKQNDVVSHFDTQILDHITDYFKPLEDYLMRLQLALFPPMTVIPKNA